MATISVAISAFASSFPAKTIELSVIGLVYTVEITDTSKVSDWLVKDISKIYVEPPITVSEILSKEIAKPFIETITTVEVFRKEIPKFLVLRDEIKMVDVLTKIAYRLAGYDVRRVYFHRVWGDIIEDTDHNIKIEVAKALLQAMKRVREKLGA